MAAFFRRSAVSVLATVSIVWGPLAVAGPSTPSAPSTGQLHPAYLRALSESRSARANLERRGGDPEMMRWDERRAVEAVDRALAELKRAAIDDGKNLQDHPPVDAHEPRAGRLQKALAVLKAARDDIAGEEDNAFADGLRERAARHVADAIGFTEQGVIEADKALEGAAASVQVVAGTYGGNCGQARGNKTSLLASTCNGKADCIYTIDSTAIGDPVSGCAKDYVAEWRCGADPTIRRASASPEAGSKKTVDLSCAPTSAPVVIGAVGAVGVEVVAGTYGGNCGQANGNKTSFLASACNGKMDCAYTIDSTAIGDPASGCAKDYVAEWRCGADPAIRRTSVSPEAGYKKTIALTCAR